MGNGDGEWRWGCERACYVVSCSLLSCSCSLLLWGEGGGRERGIDLGYGGNRRVSFGSRDAGKKKWPVGISRKSNTSPKTELSFFSSRR